MFLLVPAHPGSRRQRAVKRLLLSVCLKPLESPKAVRNRPGPFPAGLIQGNLSWLCLFYASVFQFCIIVPFALLVHACFCCVRFKYVSTVLPLLGPGAASKCLSK